MKKYLSGISILFILSAFAFTGMEYPKDLLQKKKNLDFELPTSQQWFIINLPCNEQNSFEELTTPSNYTLISGSSIPQLCSGEECICAIYATNLYGSPDLNTGSLIYSALSDYYHGNNPNSPLFVLKNQEWRRK